MTGPAELAGVQHLMNQGGDMPNQSTHPADLSKSAGQIDASGPSAERVALEEAAQSLETIGRCAGKAMLPDGEENYLRHFDQVRGYAMSRAGVARAVLAAADAAAAPQAVQGVEAVGDDDPFVKLGVKYMQLGMPRLEGLAFNAWCEQWFGGDADEDYLKRAVSALVSLTVTHPAPAPAAVPAGYALVPQSALRWLFGEEGAFECPPDRHFRGKPPAYWWRGVFREQALPPLPMHPEPHTMTWTALEARTIEDYGKACACAVQSAQPLPVRDEREAFEASHELEYPRASFRRRREKLDDGDYLCGLTQSAWEGWQARAALPQPAQAVQLSDLLGMAECWEKTAGEAEAEGWHTQAGAFKTCAADVRRAIKHAHGITATAAGEKQG